MSGILTRASASLGSFNAETRTVKAVLATETPVRRRSWESGDYDEVLVSSRDAIDSSRIDGLAVLDAHNQNGLDNRVGSVVPGSLRFLTGAAEVTIKLSRNEKGEAVFRDLEDGHLLGLSVGYRIEKTETTKAASGGVATIRATRWQPLELSFVSVPADPNAKTRSEETDMSHPRLRTQNRPLTDAEQQQRAEEDRQHHDLETRAMSPEETGLFIRTLAGPDHEALAARIQPGMSRAAVRAQMCALLVERQNQSPTFPHVDTRGTAGVSDSYNEQVSARTDALIARMTGKRPEGDARHFMGDTMLDHARGLLEAQGVNTRGMSREEVLGYRGRGFGGMHTTSDFPLLLQGAGERVLMAAYEAAQSPLKRHLSRASTATDFRVKSALKVSDGGLLQKVSEAGEITSMTRAEARESYKIDSYGRIFTLSFQALINDDLGAFSDWSLQAGQMAALTENKILLDLLTTGNGAGPVMGEDGKTLFHTAHGNVASAGTALDLDALEAAFLAFRRQKAMGGHRIGIAPKYLLVGPELEMTAQKLIAAISPTSVTDAVPASIGNLVPLVEPNLDGKGWYLFAEPGSAQVLEHAYLIGAEGVQLTTEEGFEQLATKFRAVLHFGAGAADWRGAYRNPGL